MLAPSSQNERMEAAVEADTMASVDGTGGDNGAATKLQKVYRGYQTRRKLADSAIQAGGELWWRALDFAQLSHSTISLFDKPKAETAATCWNRVASKVVEADRKLESVDGTTGGNNGAAATKLQKVYRSYRSRRDLADSAVVSVGDLWWQALDSVRLSQSTVSFFDKTKPETAASRWNRVGLNAAKVGQGSSKDVDGKADKMAFEYWLEAIDPRHRYGRSLHFYYDVWCQSQAGQPFFYWLDVGEGNDIDLPECPRALLKNQCIRYLGPQEREHYEYIINEGKIIHKQSEEPLDTSKDPEGTQWIFVMSTAKRLYVGKKERGVFQHSSFLAGGVTIVAGRVFAENGVIKAVWAYSGHYKPSKENINNFMIFLEENGVDLKDVEFRIYGLGVISPPGYTT